MILSVKMFLLPLELDAQVSRNAFDADYSYTTRASAKTTTKAATSTTRQQQQQRNNTSQTQQSANQLQFFLPACWSRMCSPPSWRPRRTCRRPGRTTRQRPWPRWTTAGPETSIAADPSCYTLWARHTSLKSFTAQLFGS